MAGTDPTLYESIQAGVGSAIDDIFVARPGKVTAYDALTNTAVVKPMVKRALYAVDDDTRTYEELPEIPFVSVIWPRAGDYVVTLPMQVGDSVLLVFCDVALAEWRADGALAEPADARRHSLGWPVAVPGFFPDSAPMSSDALDLAARIAGMIIGQHGGANRIEISSTGIKIGGDATDFVALATPTQAGLNACMAQSNAAMASAGVAIAAVGALISAISSHVHAVPAAPGTTSPATYPGNPLPSAPSAGAAAGAPGAVTATRAKAK